jgi:hypothetical protein
MSVEATITTFLHEAEIEITPIEGSDAKLAVQAFSDYGKGRRHPAQLNLADCLSYAGAKAHGIPLLYKGKNFSTPIWRKIVPLTGAIMPRRKWPNSPASVPAAPCNQTAQFFRRKQVSTRRAQ